MCLVVDDAQTNLRFGEVTHRICHVSQENGHASGVHPQ
jgi:hypothetical protein